MADYQDTINQIFERAAAEKKAFLASQNSKRLVPGKPFSNPGHSHASIVIGKLVTTTVKELVILSKHLSTKGHSAARMEAHLSRNPDVTIRVLVEGDPDGPIRPDGSIDWRELKESALVDLMIDSQTKHTNVLALDGQARPGMIAVRVLPIQTGLHFIASDKFAYRIERDHESGEAIANANDIEKAKKLTDDFDQMWLLSKPIDLSHFQLAA